MRWTPTEGEFEESNVDGNRFLRGTPMFSDGECIYMLASYRQRGPTSKVVRYMLEVYEVDIESRTMKLVKEQQLYKNNELTPYIGS